ncbi:MAG: thioredoxin family protein [Anaerolineales bacterium]|jgi:thioredoxin 1|nr:thioredoxin family protein [Anaerolineales bacterium]|tara:strand:+ start:31661 stop:31993 length:333 start_codon:yes stop_codon:yes gene_type:complete
MALDEITGETFHDEVLQADKPVLVDFWGPRCQPCIALMPALEELAEEHVVALKVVKVDASIRPNWKLSGDHKVLGLPAYLFFKDGAEIKRVTGNGITKQILEEAIGEVLN